MNVVEVGTLWRSLVLVCLLPYQVSTIYENTSRGRVQTIRMGVIISPIYWRKDIDTSSLFIIIVTALANISRVRNAQRMISVGPSQAITEVASNINDLGIVSEAGVMYYRSLFGQVTLRLILGRSI